MANNERSEIKISKDVQRLRASVTELLKRRDVVSATAHALKGADLVKDRQAIEVEITERLSPVLIHLTRLIETDEESLAGALKDVAETDREAIIAMRETYEPFKMVVQSANVYEQGYVNRITGVRYRPYVFLLSNIPTVDVTLRSFDRNVLRFADTIDNVMRVAVGILRGVSDSYHRATTLNIPIPDEISKRCATFVEEATNLIQALREQTTAAEKVPRPTSRPKRSADRKH